MERLSGPVIIGVVKIQKGKLGFSKRQPALNSGNFGFSSLIIVLSIEYSADQITRFSSNKYVSKRSEIIKENRKLHSKISHLPTFPPLGDPVKGKMSQPSLKRILRQNGWEEFSRKSVVDVNRGNTKLYQKVESMEVTCNHCCMERQYRRSIHVSVPSVTNSAMFLSVQWRKSVKLSGGSIMFRDQAQVYRQCTTRSKTYWWGKTEKCLFSCGKQLQNRFFATLNSK